MLERGLGKVDRGGLWRAEKYNWEIYFYWTNIDWAYILAQWKCILAQWKYIPTYGKYIFTEWKYILTCWTAQSWEWESQGPTGVVGWKMIFMNLFELIPFLKLPPESMVQNNKIKDLNVLLWRCGLYSNCNYHHYGDPDYRNHHQYDHHNLRNHDIDNPGHPQQIILVTFQAQAPG